MRLLVGSYIRRSDSASVRIHRIGGTFDYTVEVNGVQLDGYFTRKQAMREVTG